VTEIPVSSSKGWGSKVVSKAGDIIGPTWSNRTPHIEEVTSKAGRAATITNVERLGRTNCSCYAVIAGGRLMARLDVVPTDPAKPTNR
jgi:hypothetical protein